MIRNVEVYVEGYHDRAFIDGWLRYRGWVGRKNAVNPVTGKRVTGGRFGLASPSGSTFIEIIPVHGDGPLLTMLAERVKRAVPPDPDDIIVVLDVDDIDHDAGIERRRQSVDDRMTRNQSGVVRHGNEWLAPSGTRVHLILWSSVGKDEIGVPGPQTLERIVCSAIMESSRQRAAAVQRWLDARPDAPGTSPKAYCWSYMAGWFADRGCEAFLSGLWDDAALATILTGHMGTCGALATIEALESS